MKLVCWISGILKRYAVEIPGCSFSGFRKALFGVFTCIFALGIVLLLTLPLEISMIYRLLIPHCTGGATVGIITGALKGQTTETGFVRGSWMGAVTGAVTAVQLLELIINGESLSQVALICSLVDGKVFMDWVGPAMLKAYQWQVSSLETSYMEISDIYDTDDSARGLPRSLIERLPVLVFEDPNHHEGGSTCSICLQEFEGGECGRMLPNCGHVFHRGCLDSWLIRCGSCPICRDIVCERDDDCHVCDAEYCPVGF